MPNARTLYFPEVGPQWEDWVQVINVGHRGNPSEYNSPTRPERATDMVRSKGDKSF